MDKQRKWAGWAIIGVGAILGLTILTFHSSTAGEPPAAETAPAQENLLRQLFPYAGEGEGSFEELSIEQTDGLTMAFTVKRGEETLGYAVTQTVQGYAGPIEVLAGIRPDRTLTGIHVGGAQFQETEGLGAKAKDASFTDQFIGKAIPLTLGEDVDAIAGATITSRAVVDGINNAVSHLDPFLSPAPGSFRTANASVIGYGGPVLVRLTMSEDGVIEYADIGGARFQETEGVGSRIREKAFMEQFVGKTPPISLGDGIDAASGATVSSQAAVDAVNAAAAFLAQ